MKDQGKKQDAVMGTLKEQYQRIPVPPEARERLLEGIRQAKEESSENKSFEKKSRLKKKTGKGKMVVMLKRTAATAAAALAAITILANSSRDVAMAMVRIPVIGAIADVVTFRTYESKEGNFEARVDIPEIAPLEGTIDANQDIERYANELIAQYEADLKASSGEENYSLTSLWDVVFENETYVSIRIRTTQVMASGTEYVKIFNVDKATGKTVSLADLLQNNSQLLTAIGENIKAQMRNQMASDPSISYFLDSDTPEWDFQELTGKESYYFDREGRLVIVFDEYQVAPGYMGAVEFTIPLDVTGNLT